MLSPGDGIALAGACVLAFGALNRYTPKNNSRKCSEHSGIVVSIENMAKDIGDIKTDIKTLLGRK